MRILFLSPMFFGIPNRIRDKLVEGNVIVDFYDDHFSSSTFGKSVSRLFPTLVEKIWYSYYDRILTETKSNHYDYLFVIKGETIPKKFVEKFRSLHPEARLYMYMQDSFENFPKVIKKIKWYDKVYTFDSSNSKKHNVLFRPLFFSDEYQFRKTEDLPIYDISFIGTIHSDRYHLINSIKEHNPNLKFYFYMLVQAKIVYYVRKVTTNVFKGSKIDEFEFKPMDHHEIVNITNKSRAVLDLQQEQQVGLTMRTIEMMGLGKKLVTMNQHVKSYDFYNPSNICVIDRNHPVVDQAFLDKPYEPIDEGIVNRYSLRYFVDEIFDFKVFGGNYEQQ